METLTVELLPRETLAPLPAVIDTRQMLEAFGQFIDLTVADGNPTADTRSGYASALKPFLAWCDFQNIAPAKITPAQVKNYRAHLRDRNYAKATVALYLTAVRRFYDAALEYELIQRNPATGIKGGSDATPPEDKMSALSLNALQALVGAMSANTVAEKRDRAIVALMAFHGLRRVEVHRLDHDSLRVDSDGGVLSVPGKGNKTRRVYLRPDTLRCWQDYESAKFELSSRNARVSNDGAFFIALDPGSMGLRLSRTSMNAVVDAALNRSDLKRDGVSCHALRHTFGTLSVAGGAKIEHLRDALGHSSVATSSIYVRAVEKRQNNPSLCIGAEMKFGD